jgi:protein gp37
MRQALRLVAMGQEAYRETLKADAEGRLLPKWSGVVKVLEERLEIPKRWRKPRMVFVDSMSDLFHDDVPGTFLDAVFDVMEGCERHTFQVLTKRPCRLMDYVNRRWPPRSKTPTNIWLGTSVEDGIRFRQRVPYLQGALSTVRWLSIEPLLGPLGITADDLDGIDWVVVGGESGPRHRPMHAEWVREIRDACIAAGVPFFFKQWGGARQPPKGEPVLLDGVTWQMYPGDSHG